MFRSHVENCLVFKVSEREVGLFLDEVLHDHLVIINGDGVVNGHITVVVFSIKLWPYIVHDTRFSGDANNMFDGLTLVVLLPSCLEKLIGSSKPVEQLHVAFSGANKKHILSEIVLDNDGPIFELFKNLKNWDAFPLTGNEER